MSKSQLPVSNNLHRKKRLIIMSIIYNIVYLYKRLYQVEFRCEKNIREESMKKNFVRVVALTAVLSLATINMGFASGGSIGHGDISVYKNGVVVNKLSGQNPVEDSMLMVCDGKCMVKSDGISVLAADQAQIAISNETDTFNLYVKEGSVDYVINNNARKIAFYTPEGSYTVAEVVFNADSGSVVKGTVAVASDGSTEISVTEGRMVFATADGMKAVDANNKIVLAATAMVPPAEADDTNLIPWLVGGAAVIAVIAIIANNNDSSSSNNDTPPPTTESKPKPASPSA